MDIKKVKKCPYNPRTMSKSAMDGLKESMEEFGNLSGIVINESNGNVIAGNHRFDHLCKKHGKANLELNHSKNDYWSIDLKQGGSTGFQARIVDWEDDKEKLANIVANSDLIAGEYTSGVQSILSKIKITVPSITLDKLRVSNMIIDSSLEDALDLDTETEEDTADIVRTESEKSTRKETHEEDDDHTAPSQVREIVSNVKIIAPAEYIEEIKFDLLEALSDKAYFNEITISG
jgi:hypothetical protein